MTKTSCLFLFMFLLGTIHSQTAHNLIVNGEFTQNNCRGGWCISRSTDMVPGWIPDPQIQIGSGRFYSDFLGNEKIIELAPNSNSCIYQVVKNLQSGNYELKVEYLPKKDRTFQDCMFSVSFNDVLLKEIKPSKYQIDVETIKFPVYKNGDAKLRFCAFGGEDNAEGAVLKSVSLIKDSSALKNPSLPAQPNPNQPQSPSQNIPGLTIDSHSNKCFQKQYQVQGGSILITFDYRLISSSPVKQSVTIVTIDGQPIFKVDSSNSETNVKLQGRLEKGTHFLGFCPVGSDKDQVHEIKISNIVLSEKLCTADWTDDLIVNGGFEQNSCRANTCIYTDQTTPIPVQGWIASPQIQVVKTTVSNPAFSSTWVAELAGNRNTCIKQNLKLKPGKIEISFNWAARLRTTITNKGFDLKLNGKTLASFKATDFKVNEQVFQYNVETCPSEGFVIEFCGTGTNDAFGVLIDNVKVRNYDQCAKQQLIQY